MIQRQQIQNYLNTDAPWLMIEALCTDIPLVNGRAPGAEMCSAPQTSLPSIRARLHSMACFLHWSPAALAAHQAQDRLWESWAVLGGGRSECEPQFQLDASGHSTDAMSKNHSGTPEFRNHLTPLLLFIHWHKYLAPLPLFNHSTGL